MRKYMIKLDDAYNRMKEHTDFPLLMIYENDTHFIGTNSLYILIDKEKGDVTKEYNFTSLLSITNVDDLKPVFYQNIFDNFIEYYKRHYDEKSLAHMYASVWYIVYHAPTGDSNEKRLTDAEESVFSRWKQIEGILYRDIRGIIDNEDIDYPPCVLNHFDDPFFRIKPFMVRNGYTDNGYGLWVESYIY